MIDTERSNALLMRLSLKYLIGILFSLPKTICFNIRCLPLKQAVKLPFFIHYKTRFHGVCRDSVKIVSEGHLHTFMIKMGNRGSEGIIEHRYNSICVNKGTILFNGPAAIAVGFSMRIDNNGQINIGRGFNANRNLFISSTKQVVIGNDVLFGWNVSVRDSDGHTLIHDGISQPTLAPVVIGNHVWVCAESQILKGASVGDDCVVGYASLLSKGSNESHILWAGHPAKMVKQDINWDSKAWDVECCN